MAEENSDITNGVNMEISDDITNTSAQPLATARNPFDINGQGGTNIRATYSYPEQIGSYECPSWIKFGIHKRVMTVVEQFPTTTIGFYMPESASMPSTVSWENEKIGMKTNAIVNHAAPAAPKRKTPKAIQRYQNELLTYQNNCDKWKAAKLWCEHNNFVFIILTERNSGGIF